MAAIAKILLLIHMIAGFSSLAIFWIPVFTKKGGVNHVRLGRVYVKLMWVVVLTAGLLSIKNLLIANWIMAAFLGFLALITAKVLWIGIAVLKNKKENSDSFNNIQQGLDVAIVGFGLLLTLYGIYLKGQGAGVLMLIFGILGLADYKKALAFWRKEAPAKADWFNDHIEGMITSGIAAYTAFLVFGGSQFFSSWFTGSWSIILWVAPTVIGVFSMKFVKGYYAQKKMA